MLDISFNLLHYSLELRLLRLFLNDLLFLFDSLGLLDHSLLHVHMIELNLYLSLRLR